MRSEPWGGLDAGFCLWDQKRLQGGGAAWDPGLRSPQPSPQPQDQGRVNSADRPSASMLIHTLGSPQGTRVHTATHSPIIHTQAHIPPRCHQKVTEHTTQTGPCAAAHSDMMPRDTCSYKTHTTKHTGSQMHGMQTPAKSRHSQQHQVTQGLPRQAPEAPQTLHLQHPGLAHGRRSGNAVGVGTGISTASYRTPD